jgi:hypothetical protein
MAKSKNRYEKKASRASFAAMAAGLPTKGSVKNTLIETGKDLLVGVIGGGLIGAAIGRPSLVIGTVVTGVGHFMGQRLIGLAGIGMMAANGFHAKTVSGVEGIDGIKDRVMAFKDSFSEKLYLDKIMKKKTDAVAGLGDLQYFNYANEVAGLAALNNMEEAMENSAMARLQMSGTSMGYNQAIETMEGGLSDVEDYNL